MKDSYLDKRSALSRWYILKLGLKLIWFWWTAEGWVNIMAYRNNDYILIEGFEFAPSKKCVVVHLEHDFIKAEAKVGAKTEI